MANIERFIGPLGIGKTDDIEALFDYQEVSNHPSYSASKGYGGEKSFYLSVAHYAGLNCTAAKTKVVGFWANETPFANYTTSGVGYCLIRFDGPDIRIYNTSSGFDIRRGNTQIATSTSKISNNLTHVEIKVFSDASVGTVEIKINGVSVYSGTGLNTDGADITRVDFSCCFHGVYYSGAFIADDWVGALIPKLLTPNGDDSKQLTPSAGSDNYAMVDETAEDGDTTYVQSNTSGHKDIYTFTDLESGYEPKVISIVMVAKEADAGGKGMKILSVQDSTERTHLTTSPLPATYPSAIAVGQSVTLDDCPDGTALSRTKLNAIKFGVEVV